MSSSKKLCKSCKGRGCRFCRMPSQASSIPSSGRETTERKNGRDALALKNSRNSPPAVQSRISSKSPSPAMHSTVSEPLFMSANLDRSQAPELTTTSKKDSISSTLKTKFDVEMARRQTSIRTLPLKEQQKQNAWAQGQLKKNGSSSCPVGLIWIRENDGYWCLGGGHFVSDVLLEEGKGGYYKGDRTEGKDFPKDGPIYGKDPDWSDFSEKQLAQFRLEDFGSKNPTEKDKHW